MALQRLDDATFARRVAIALAVAVLLLFLWRIADALLLAFAAVLVGILLRAAADPLARRTFLPDWAALLLVALLTAAGLAIVVWLIGAEVRAQAAELASRIPAAWEALRGTLAGTPFAQQVVQRAGSVLPDFAGVLTQMTGFAGTALGAFTNLVLVLFGGLYFAIQPRLYRNGLLKLVPSAAHDSVADTLDASGEALRRWLLGQMVSMGVAASLTMLGLWLLGLPGYLALGLLAGLAEFVPVIGSILAAVPALLLALAQGGLDFAVWTLLLYLVVQQFQGNFVVPLVTRRMVSLPPALTLFNIVAFGLVFGPRGVLLAAPLTVVVFVAVKRLWVREALGKATHIPGEDGSGRAAGAD